MTIDDLLKNKSRLAGRVQESLATRNLRSKKASAGSSAARRTRRNGLRPLGGEDQKSNVAPSQFRDIPTSEPNLPAAEAEQEQTSPQESLLANEGEEQAAGTSLREQVIQAKQEEANKKAKEEEKAATGEEATGTKKWSARALALAFWFLPTVIFFVPAILYIDIHILLRWILGKKFFCRLGDEAGITKIASITGKLAEGVTKEYRRIIDIIVVLFSNVVFLATVFTVVAVIAAIAGAGGGQGWKVSDYVGAASNATAAAALGAWMLGWTGPISWLGGLSLWGISDILWGAQTGLQMLGQ